MQIALNKLCEFASAATPGPWFAKDWHQDDGPDVTTIEAHEPEVLHPGQSSIWPGGVRCIRIADTADGDSPLPDAAFIAACSPDVILAMVAAIRAGQRMMAAIDSGDASLDDAEVLDKALQPFSEPT